PAARKRVVIAEDEALIRLDLNETLGELGFDVVGEAGDGERAVALAEELRPDLVILDVKMPVLDGISAARRIAAARIAPVIILTAFSQRELVERARDAGAMAYLVKPFSSTELLPAIAMAMSRYAEVGSAHSVVREQVTAGAFEHDRARFEHVAARSQVQRLCSVLFDQDDGHTGLVDLPDDAEDLVDDHRGKAH